MEMSDKPRENCGLVGVFSFHKDAVSHVLYGLVNLQHRGQEGAGVVVSDGKRLTAKKGMGLITSIFTKEIVEELREGYIAIAHTRYSTSGRLSAVQPFVEDGVGLAHNGNITNISTLSTIIGINEQDIMSDTWLTLKFILSQKVESTTEKIRRSLPKLAGAYSFLAITPDALYVMRDPWGFRPLVLGRLPSEGWIVASETCAFTANEATFEREILPGEAIRIDKNGVETIYFDNRGPLSRCIFEYIYIARPDSRIFGSEVHVVRRRCGQILAREAPVEADVVVSIPHSGDSACHGFSEASRIPMVEGVFANRYIGRAFIEPLHRRKQTTKVKYGVIRSDIEGKRVCAVDDSLIRGDASRSFVGLLRDHDAKEVHLRIAAPPLRFPCFYGVDFATPQELIARREKDLEGIRLATGADSLHYLSYEGLLKAVTNVDFNLKIPPEELFSANGFCGACFTGQYPVATSGVAHKEDMKDIYESTDYRYRQVNVTAS